MTFELGRLAQIVHVTDDLATARHFYADVLGGQSFYEGYSPFEKRDASIYAIGDVTIEPMSPSDEPGASEMPVGRFLTRFGPRLHSIAINATGIRSLADHLLSSGVRVVGPGGSSVDTITNDPPVSIYTHPRDTGFLIEFADFGAPLLQSSPRLAVDWNPLRWAADHPAGITGWSHVTALVRDVDSSLSFLVDVLGASVLMVPTSTPAGIAARIRLGSESVVQLLQPATGTGHHKSLERDGEGLVELTLTVTDLGRAAAHLEQAGVPIRFDAASLVLDTGATAGAPLVLIEDDNQ